MHLSIYLQEINRFLPVKYVSNLHYYNDKVNASVDLIESNAFKAEENVYYKPKPDRVKEILGYITSNCKMLTGKFSCMKTRGCIWDKTVKLCIEHILFKNRHNSFTITSANY